jgi:hypothetical protein
MEWENLEIWKKGLLEGAMKTHRLISVSPENIS